MTEDITPQVLAQIRQDIAALGDRVASEITGVRDDLTRRIEDLTRRTDVGFAHTAEQLSSVVALMGVLAKNDDRLERRIQAIEERLAEPGY